jgi:dnd system-associated protein 4
VRPSDDWPDRVYVEVSQYEKMHELCSKSSDEGRDAPFRSLKEVLMAAAMFGYNLGQKSPLESRKEIIFTKYLDSQLDLPLVVCLAIADQGNTDVIDDKKRVIEIFQNYIKGGFEPLYEIIKEGPDAIQNYAHYLLENYIKEVI